MRDDTIHVLHALAQRERLRVLEVFAEHDQLSPTGAQPHLQVPVPTIAHHVRRLVEFGLLEPVGERPRRGAVERFYRLTRKAHAGLAAVRQLDDELDRA